jgi:hypothetical protein
VLSLSWCTFFFDTHLAFLFMMMHVFIHAIVLYFCLSRETLVDYHETRQSSHCLSDSSENWVSFYSVVILHPFHLSLTISETDMRFRFDSLSHLHVICKSLKEVVHGNWKETDSPCFVDSSLTHVVETSMSMWFSSRLLWHNQYSRESYSSLDASCTCFVAFLLYTT